ncbi:MAG: TlpA disulfide reductase family protein [Crocinitomicaceae bacterium]|nr:TlpA disulfide reductase family protein [Crocinitomicaceae bacterium]
MEIKPWLKKRKWDVLTVVIIGLMFIPSVRMVVVSNMQRLFAGAPSEISVAEQKTVNSMDWVLLDLEGKTHNMSAAHGKIIVVNLWATWCPPCVAEMPSLQKLYAKYGDRVAFYFVSNEKVEVLNRFLTVKKYNFPVYIPGSEYPKEFNSNSLPTTYVIDPNGKIMMEEVGAHDWFSASFQKRLDEMLKS